MDKFQVTQFIIYAILWVIFIVYVVGTLRALRQRNAQKTKQIERELNIKKDLCACGELPHVTVYDITGKPTRYCNKCLDLHRKNGNNNYAIGGKN